VTARLQQLYRQAVVGRVAADRNWTLPVYGK